jgi:LysM repeat protein
MIEGPSTARGAAADPVSCPYLGLADDRASHFAFATSAHRCHSAVGSELIAVSHQAALCLTADHPSCKRYKVPAAIGAGPTGARPTAAPAATGQALADAGGGVRWRGAGQPQRGRALRAAAVLVGALAIVGFVALGLRASTPAAPSGVAGSIASVGLASPVGTPATSPASPAVILASPQPTPSSSAATPGAASATPSASVRDQPIIHIVVRGDTLTSIARTYGVTLLALESANPTIQNPSLIVVGQRIVIPVP